MTNQTETKKESKFKVLTVEGIAMYASVHTPKKGFNPTDIPTYTLDLVVNDATAKILANEGLKVAKTQIDENTKAPKEYDEFPGQKVFKFSRKIMKQDGTQKSPPEVVDSECNPIPPNVLIGNGSKVNVTISPYKTTTMKQAAGELLGVQVLELVPYTTKKTTFTKTTGFTINTTNTEGQGNENTTQGGTTLQGNTNNGSTDSQRASRGTPKGGNTQTVNLDEDSDWGDTEL